MSRAVLIILHLMALDFRQDGTRARSFLIHILESTALTVQLYWGRKEAPTSASKTLWTNIHTRCGYTDLPMSNHLSTDVYLQMVRVRRVCASLLILFALASLSVYRSLTAVGILHIRAVSHQSVTYGSFSWRNQFVLSQSQGQLQQAFRCTCTSVRKGLGGRATRTTRRRLLTGFDHFVSGVSGSSGDAWPSCSGGTSRPRWFSGRQELNRCSAPGESPTVSQILANFRFTPTHTIQAPRKKTVASTCRQRKNKSSRTSPNLGASCTDGWRGPQLHECTNCWAFKSPFFINSITPQLPSPFPPCLISPPPWAKVIICSFIKLDNIPCVVEACTQESRPYCSSLQHFVLLAHYFTHALLFYQALLK